MAYAHYGLGTAQARQGRHAEAIASFQTAISLGSKNARTFTQLGLSLRAQGDEPAALQAFEAALAVDPRYTEAREALKEK